MFRPRFLHKVYTTGNELLFKQASFYRIGGASAESTTQKSTAQPRHTVTNTQSSTNCTTAARALHSGHSLDVKGRTIESNSNNTTTNNTTALRPLHSKTPQISQVAPERSTANVTTSKSSTRDNESEIHDNEFVTVQTENGPIIGKKLKIENDSWIQNWNDYGMTDESIERLKKELSETRFSVFLGVPFAKPPVKELRFKKPQKPEPWTEPLKCLKYRDRCAQINQFWDYFLVNHCSEDCLYLNVFAPEREPHKQYPVVFYIHGGGFVMDGCTRFSAKRLCNQLVKRGIVVVTVTYRLGFLGFMTTGDSACKGNFGLFDQLMALEWTKNNIEKFGGDPNDITVAGQSAGAVSADLLSISPLSRDLFQKKILMGGNSFCHWAVAKNEHIVSYCEKKARELGFRGSETGKDKLKIHTEMVDYLRTVPVKKLSTTMFGEKMIFDESRLPLAPVYDGDFLPRSVRQLREEAPHMESIVGVGKYEALVFVPLGNLKCNGKDIDHVLQRLAKNSKNFNMKDIISMTKRIYGDTDVIRSNKELCAKLFVTMSSDIMSNRACWKYMKYSQKHQKNTFVYSFDYVSKKLYGLVGSRMPFIASTHSTELAFFLDQNFFFSPYSKTATDHAMVKITGDYFASFVKTGNPNCELTSLYPEWEPLRKVGNMDMFSLDLPPRVRQGAFNDRMRRLDIFIDEALGSSDRVVGEAGLATTELESNRAKISKKSQKKHAKSADTTQSAEKVDKLITDPLASSSTTNINDTDGKLEKTKTKRNMRNRAPEQVKSIPKDLTTENPYVNVDLPTERGAKAKSADPQKSNKRQQHLETDQTQLSLRRMYLAQSPVLLTDLSETKNTVRKKKKSNNEDKDSGTVPRDNESKTPKKKETPNKNSNNGKESPKVTKSGQDEQDKKSGKQEGTSPKQKDSNSGQNSGQNKKSDEKSLKNKKNGQSSDKEKAASDSGDEKRSEKKTPKSPSSGNKEPKVAQSRKKASDYI